MIFTISRVFLKPNSSLGGIGMCMLYQFS
ncbi:hypothetical protein LINGRAPRIM_LOCUS1329 [Linum grandiflorum]